MSRFHLHNWQWERVREDVLDRDNWKCRHCGGYANQVDHVIPIFKGGKPYERDNLQTLCRDCHIDKSRVERGKSRSLVTGSRAWDYYVLQNMKEGV
ncbi:MAG: HNH endonuclease [Nitrospira sp. SB0662_bin_26]|nr:HNH endonuclease [Nitrospira sp. SB0662_bin_26]